MKNGFALASALISLSPALAQTYVASTSTATYAPLTSGTVVTLTGTTPPETDGIAQIPIGFNFPFYDRVFDKLTVTANGNLWLTPPLAVTYDFYYSNTVIPSASTPNGIISPLWDDLSGKTGEATSNISYQNSTDAAGQVFTIQWSNWNYENTTATLELNFQVKLHESGLIEFHYGPVSGSAPSGTFSASVGIENFAGNAGTTGLGCTPSCLPTDIIPNQVITFGPPAQADLTVSQLRIDGVVQVGSNLQISTTTAFRNFGGTAANGFNYALFLSNNTTYEPGTDTPFSPATQGPVSVASLGIGSHSATSTVAKPTTGSYYVLAVADFGGAVTEANESNNVGVISAPLVSGVDLVAQSVGGPAAASPGEAITLSYAFTNQGIDPAGSVPFKIFASADNALSAGDVELASSTVTVAGGQNVISTINVTFPTNVQAGDYFYILQVDNGPAVGSVVEINEMNNQVLSTGKLESRQPDLAVTGLQILEPAPPYAVADSVFFGEPTRLQVVVANVGKAAANNFTVSFYLSENESLMAFTDPFIGDKTGLSLAPAQQMVVTITAPLPSKSVSGEVLKPADYYIFASAAGAFADASTANNVLKSTPQRARGPAPDLVATSLTAPTLLAAGEVFGVSRTLRNVGNRPSATAPYRYYLSANTIITASDTLLTIKTPTGVVNEGSVTLNAGETNTQTELLMVPHGTLAGQYYVGVLVDPSDNGGSGVVLELSETNNGFTSQLATVQPQKLEVITPALPDAVVGTPYDVQLSSTGGGAGGYRYELSGDGAPPAGLNLSLEGKLSGTPTATGTANFVVKVSSGGRTANARLILRVVPFTTGVALTTVSLPSLVRGLPFETTLGVLGGQAPYRWVRESGTLPTGLTLAESGKLSGTTTASVGAVFAFAVRVRDVAGNSDVRSYTVTVLDSNVLEIETPVLPQGRIGSDYGTDIVAKNSQGGPLAAPLTWTIVAGALPPGLTLESTDIKGLITGTPTLAGNFALSLQVTDARSRTDTADFLIQVVGSAVKIKGNLPAQVERGAAVQGNFTLEGATSGTFGLYDGVLPPGVTLSPKGELSGTVEQEAPARIYSFTVSGLTPTGEVALGAFSMEVTTPGTAVKTGCAAAGSALAPALGLLLLALARRRRRG